MQDKGEIVAVVPKEVREGFQRKDIQSSFQGLH